MTQSRRTFLHSTGLGLLSFTLAGSQVLLSPRQARAKGAELKVLTEDEVATLEAFGDVLAPGAAEAGIAHFVDQQLSVDPNECLLMLKYFNIEPPYDGFYRGGLAAVNQISHKHHDKPFEELDEQAAVNLVREFSAANPPDWEGPPSPLVYLLIRSDAVDVVYGTVEGFQNMGIPYMPHILPPEKW